MQSLFKWRFYFVILVLLTMLTGLAYRLSKLMVYERDFLQGQSEARVTRTITSPVSRGVVYDRNGLPMAVSTVQKSLWIDPSEVNIDQVKASNVADLLHMNKSSLIKKIETNKNKSFVYLQRHLQPKTAEKISGLKLMGFGLQKEFKRYYPDAEAAAQLIGRTNIDEKGVEGLELAYNSWLQGQDGKYVVTKDRLGRVLEKQETLAAAKDGKDIYLSIDKTDQAVAYNELSTGVKLAGAKSGSVVVIDVKTGEVIALTNYPSYNPNNTKNLKAEFLRNRAITDLFEPGSTMKPISMLSSLNSGAIKLTDKVFVGDGNMELEGHVIHDVHNSEKNISLTDIIVHSSNVGIAKVVLSMPVTRLLEDLAGYGIGESTGSGFPGEPSSVISSYIRQGTFDQASLSYGYGLSTTLLQLSRAYLNLASCGSKTNVSLIKINDSSSTAAIDDVNCKAVHAMMSKVTQIGGTGFRAAVKGYNVAGKTGTSYISSNKGYDTDKYTASFAGFAPAEDPRYVVAVVLWEPEYEYRYGGKSAAPIFANIMQHMLVFKDSKVKTRRLN